MTFHRGLPNIEDFDGSEPVRLVIDDLMNEADESVANLFTKGPIIETLSYFWYRTYSTRTDTSGP